MIEHPEDKDPGPEEWSYALLVVKDGEPTQAYRDELMSGRYDALHVVKVDLDADGNEERVVALWNAQGNGLGINTWTIRVFSRDWRLLHQFDDVLDWGPSSVVRPSRSSGRGCDLAITSYVSDQTGGRDGTAFEARFMRLSDGQFAEAKDRPRIRRRLTNSLLRDRAKTFERGPHAFEGDVARWLSRLSRPSPATAANE